MLRLAKPPVTGVEVSWRHSSSGYGPGGLGGGGGCGPRPRRLQLSIACALLAQDLQHGRTSWAPEDHGRGATACTRPPTNVVWRVGHLSERELDWVFLNPDTRCVGAERRLLLGLRRHLMLECDPLFRERISTVADPLCQ